MDLTGLSSVADFATGVMDRFFPKQMTEAEKTQAQAGLQAALEQRDLARDTIKAEVLKAELSQGDNYTKRARPTVVYAGLAFIGLVHVVFPVLVFITGRPAPTLSLPGEFWWAWGGVVSVWQIGRSAERMGGATDIIKAVTGGR